MCGEAEVAHRKLVGNLHDNVTFRIHHDERLLVVSDGVRQHVV